MFAKSLIMGKLNFYLPFLGAENKETLEPLTKGLNEALRLITGGFCSTPIPVLHAQSGIPPLSILIKEAAGNLWSALKFRPNCLTEEYDNWEAIGDNGYTPLAALWEFEYELLKYFQPRAADGSHLPLDEFCEVSKKESEALYRCQFHNIHMSKEQAKKLHDQNALPLPYSNHQL